MQIRSQPLKTCFRDPGSVVSDSLSWLSLSLRSVSRAWTCTDHRKRAQACIVFRLPSPPPRAASRDLWDVVTIHTDLENVSEVVPTLIASFLNDDKFPASQRCLQLSLQPREIQLLSPEFLF